MKNQYGEKSIEVGRHSYIVGAPKLSSFGWENIEIGAFCSIAHNVTFNTDCGHDYYKISTFPFKEIMGIGISGCTHRVGIKIGNDVWIGTGVVLMPGITIGDGAVIGAFSVVAKDIPPYAVVVGNPARINKYRFSDEKIKELLASKWWDNSDEWIKENIEWLTT
jgi:virginiamycin A acetyltransferase